MKKPGWFLFLAGLLSITACLSAPPTAAYPGYTPSNFAADEEADAANSRRINAPYDVTDDQAAIAWFGRVTSTDNAVDVRVSYNDTSLYVRLAVYDRRLWYDETPTLNTLPAWDSATLYVDLDGNSGSTLGAHAYRFDGQLVWWEPRGPYQAAYRGQNGNWAAAQVPFTTTSWWRGDEPNNDADDRGWTLIFDVPFASLGLDGAPYEGTVWGLAFAAHDRDDAAGTPIADQVWPEGVDARQPATWGQLRFELPVYSPPLAGPGGTVTIRQGLNGATVEDGAVGGGSNCGAGLDYWTEWGQTNYAGLDYFNIQNQGDFSDWPCFSRYYVTFPLGAVPAGKAILSATLTLHQFGNAGEGWDPGPEPSLIQVLRIRDDWDEATLTWNNGPLALENVSAAWTYPLDPPPPRPGVARQFDVTGAAAAAYAAGSPLRLALYEADWAYHSGKYFVSSDADDWEAAGRPTLTVTWGEPEDPRFRICLPVVSMHN